MLSVRAAGPTIHHEAIDWATRAAANGGAISTTTIRAVSEFCRAVDLAGIRDRFARLNLFCGGNLSGALVPLYRATSFGGTVIGNTTDTNVNFVSGDYSDTGSTAGIKGNGSTKYINTGVLANSLTANDAHLGIGLVTADTAGSTSYRCAIGAYNNASNSFEISLRRSTGFGVRSCFFTRFATATDNFGDDVNATTLAAGNIVAAWPNMYRNGAASGITATTSQNYPSAHSIFVFALAQNGTTPINYSDARLGWYSIGRTMTASQVADYSTALANLRTALGR